MFVCSRAGFPEIAAAPRLTEQIVFLANDRTGTITTLLPKPSNSPTGLAAVDLDWDGRLRLALLA